MTAASENSGTSENINPQIVTIQTSQGPVEILYDLQRSGQTLHLKDIMVYARKGHLIGGVLRELLAARRQIAEYAKELGYNKVRITGHRTLQSSSANPGKQIDLMIKPAEMMVIFRGVGDAEGKPKRSPTEFTARKARPRGP